MGRKAVFTDGTEKHINYSKYFEMNNCIYCGAPLDDDSQFCANCGKRIKLCPKCGSVLKGDSLFCAKCGTRLDMRTPPMGPQQIATNTTTLKVDDNVADDVVEEEKRNWVYLISGCAIIALLILSWLGYTQFYKYTHIDVHELLEELQLPKEYYHSAKEIVNRKGFDKDYYFNNKYMLRGWIVYNEKYGNEIKFNNKSFNSDKDAIEGYYEVVGHILDCWNTSPAVAVYEQDRQGISWVNEESTFYYTSNKSKGIQFVMISNYDEKGNLEFQSVDGKYEANFKQVHL